MTSVEELKDEFRKIKEFSLVFIQILIFMAKELADTLSVKEKLHGGIYNIIAGEWFQVPRITLVQIVLSSIVALLLLIAIAMFSWIVFSEFSFFELREGVEKLDKVLNRYRTAIKLMATASILFIILYILLKIY